VLSCCSPDFVSFVVRTGHVRTRPDLREQVAELACGVRVFPNACDLVRLKEEIEELMGGFGGELFGIAFCNDHEVPRLTRSYSLPYKRRAGYMAVEYYQIVGKFIQTQIPLV
jgi:hypothetical protein